MKNSKFLYVFLAATLILTGCSKQQPSHQPVIAKNEYHSPTFDGTRWLYHTGIDYSSLPKTSLNDPNTYRPALEPSWDNFSPVIETVTYDGKLFPTITTKRLVIREFTIKDLEALHHWRSKPNVALSQTWPVEKSIAETKNTLKMWLRGYDSGEALQIGIFKKTGEMVGSWGFFDYYDIYKKITLAYSFDETYWGQGYATEAVKAILQYSFTELDLNRIDAVARVDNVGSWKVMQKSGMSYEGTMREFWISKGMKTTMHMFAAIKSDFEGKLPPLKVIEK